MKLENIKQIQQTKDQERCNEFIAKGFRIIKILSSKEITADNREIVKPVYVLGLPGEDTD